MKNKLPDASRFNTNTVSATPVKAAGMKRKDGAWVYYIVTLTGSEVTDVWESQVDSKAIIEEVFKIAIVKNFFNE